MNGNIRFNELKVIDENGEQLGILDTQVALEMAQERDLDLVVVSAEAKPAVAKFMNYGKMLFERNKKQKEARKQAKLTETKEIRVSSNIAKHDLEFKSKNAREFLNKGNRVKISMRFRGREIVKSDIGKQVLIDFAENLSDISDVIKEPSLEGRSMYMILAKKK